MLIARVEDKYVFLTNEEKEIENEIRNVDVDFSAINKKLASIIFDDILKSRKYRYPANKQDFDISRFLNGHPLDGAVLNDLVVKILTLKIRPIRSITAMRPVALIRQKATAVF